MFYFKRKLTLLELVVVLGVLVALASVAYSVFNLQEIRIGPSQKNTFEVLTESNLRTLQNAIMGSDSQPGYYSDLGGIPTRMPRTLLDLFQVPSSLPLSLQTFDPHSKLGWRGPYLSTHSGRYGIQDGASFVFRPSFDSTYGNPEDPAILDAWGNPIVLQIELDGILSGISSEDAQFCRLVSAGPNGILETPVGTGNIVPGSNPSTELTLDECGDDILLFLQVNDARE